MEDIASLDRVDAPADGRVIELAVLLADHKGVDAVALDLRNMNSWTDYFVIATVTSSTHMRGLLKHIKDFLGEHGMETLHKHAGSEDDEWSLVDCGTLVVHLMSQKARSFYDLERLWFQARKLFGQIPASRPSIGE